MCVDCAFRDQKHMGAMSNLKMWGCGAKNPLCLLSFLILIWQLFTYSLSEEG